MDAFIRNASDIGFDVLTGVDVNLWAVAMAALELSTMLAGSKEASLFAL